MVAEKIGKNTSYVHLSDYDRTMKNVEKACSDGDSFALLKIIEDLDGKKEFTDLRKGLNKIFEEVQDREIKSILAEMARINKEELKPEKGEDGVDEDAAKKAAEEFIALAKRLNKNVVAPSLERIKILMERRSRLKYREDRLKVDKEIKKLAKKIAAFKKFFDKETNRSYLEQAIAKHGLTDEYKEIMGFYLASKYFSRVYAGKRDKDLGRKLSMKTAKKKIHRALKRFESGTLSFIADNAASLQGSKDPVYRSMRKARSASVAKDRLWKNFKKREQKNYKRYCTGFLGPSSMNRCKRWRQGQTKRAQRVKRYADYLDQRIKRYNGEVAMFKRNYSVWRSNELKERKADSEALPGGSNISPFLSEPFIDEEFRDDPLMSPRNYNIVHPSMSMPMPMNNNMYMPMNNNMYMPMNNNMFMQQPQIMMGPSRYPAFY
jgi:hypothetical protein